MCVPVPILGQIAVMRLVNILFWATPYLFRYTTELNDPRKEIFDFEALKFC